MAGPRTPLRSTYALLRAEITGEVTPSAGKDRDRSNGGGLAPHEAREPPAPPLARGTPARARRACGRAPCPRDGGARSRGVQGREAARSEPRAAAQRKSRAHTSVTFWSNAALSVHLARPRTGARHACRARVLRGVGGSNPLAPTSSARLRTLSRKRACSLGNVGIIVALLDERGSNPSQRRDEEPPRRESVPRSARHPCPSANQCQKPASQPRASGARGSRARSDAFPRRGVRAPAPVRRR